MLQKLNNKLSNKKGFTLMEMLIVVAIIAILVAIAIPTFAGQLERANQATDAANVRAAYAEAMVDAISSGDNTGSATTDAVMKSAKWDKLTDAESIGGVAISSITKTKNSKETVTVSIDAAGKTTVTFAAAS